MNDDAHLGSFCGVSPSQYHRWRLESELYGRVERPLLLPILSQIPYRRALDIGCGTGVWACTLHHLRPESETVGIDIAGEMISFAARECPARFEVADAAKYRNSGRFELVISALSADYIGFPEFFATVKANLADTGVAFTWFLDPRHYPAGRHGRMKSWQIGGREVSIEVPEYDVSRVADVAADAGLCCTVWQTPFLLADHVERTLICVQCAPT